MIDLDALIAQLRERGESREELRRLLFGDGPDVQQALGELAAAQQRTEQRVGELAERMDALAAAQQRTEQRVGELAERMDALAQRVGELAERMDALAQRVGELAESMTRLTEEVRALTKRMDAIVIRADRAHGYLVERRYAEKGHAYFAKIARRLRPLGPVELDALFDETGLTEEDADEVRYADSIFAGRLRTDDRDGYPRRRNLGDDRPRGR